LKSLYADQYSTADDPLVNVDASISPGEAIPAALDLTESTFEREIPSSPIPKNANANILKYSVYESDCSTDEGEDVDVGFSQLNINSEWKETNKEEPVLDGNSISAPRTTTLFHGPKSKGPDSLGLKVRGKDLGEINTLSLGQYPDEDPMNPEGHRE
jgi:hypothetical protein